MFNLWPPSYEDAVKRERETHHRDAPPSYNSLPVLDGGVSGHSEPVIAARTDTNTRAQTGHLQPWSPNFESIFTMQDMVNSSRQEPTIPTRTTNSVSTPDVHVQHQSTDSESGSSTQVDDSSRVSIKPNRCMRPNSEDKLMNCCQYYMIVVIILAIPTGIAFLVIAQTNGSRNKHPMPTTNQNLSHTSSLHNSTNNTTITYGEKDNGRPQCPASGSLLNYMSATGGLAFVVCLFLSMTILVPDQCNHCLFYLLVAITPINYLGTMEAYKVWNDRPDECSPFDQYGCPYSYCDNRVMGFTVIAYPCTCILFTPLWLIPLIFLLWYWLKKLIIKIRA